MVVFLTSSPTKEISESCPEPALYECNGFVEQLSAVWPEEANCLMIAAFPEAHALNDEMTSFYREAVENSGFSAACFELWDDRSAPMTREVLQAYDVIFLAGGHVPTELRWFESIGLRELLVGYEGVVIGTSAGSMNGAKVVYAWPEEPGETKTPVEQLFLPGLGLAETVVLPHYQKLKGGTLDGLRLFEDIACSHSIGRIFYAIPDGSFVLAEGERETLFGEGWLIADGIMTPFSREGESRRLI
jgi:dipeptidase E